MLASKIRAAGDPEKRQEHRFASNPNDAVVHVPGRSTPLTAIIVDVSKSGLKLEVGEALSAGTELRVDMPRLVVAGDVRYCRELGEPGSFSIGVQIREVTERSR